MADGRQALTGQAESGALVKNTRVSNKSDADSFLMDRSVTGLVINKLDRPNDEEVGTLRGPYPGFDPDKVVLIQAFREPPAKLASFNARFSLIAGFVVVACFAAVIWDFIPGLAPQRKKKKRRRRIVDPAD